MNGWMDELGFLLVFVERLSGHQRTPRVQPCSHPSGIIGQTRATSPDLKLVSGDVRHMRVAKWMDELRLPFVFAAALLGYRQTTKDAPCLNLGSHVGQTGETSSDVTAFGGDVWPTGMNECATERTIENMSGRKKKR